MQKNQSTPHQVTKNQYHIQIIAKPILLQLKKSFNTAHSSSISRTNFLIKSSFKSSKLSSSSQIQHKKLVTGYGQCGLPPKKPFCYLSNIDDCQNFITILLQGYESFYQSLELNLKSKNFVVTLLTYLKIVYNQLFFQNNSIEIKEKQHHQNVLKFFKEKFFKLIQNSNEQLPTEQMVFYLQVFYLLVNGKQLSHKNPAFKAPRNALQFSLLDLIGQIEGIQISQILSNNSQQVLSQLRENYSFYTISHEENIQKMLQNGKECLIYTDCMKIKFDNQVQKLSQLLHLMNCEEVGRKWIIDANASWTPADYKKFQLLLNELASKNKSIRQKILFIEQPFPIFKILADTKSQLQIQVEKKEWQQIKSNTSFLIVADESFASREDLDEVMKYSHGINIKMQKCGGPIEAVNIMREVQKRKIEYFMFGSMVSTHLGCTQTFQFHKYSKYFDIDGALLLKNPQIKGGFEWKASQGIKKVQGFGLAINKQDVQRLFQ